MKKRLKTTLATLISLLLILNFIPDFGIIIGQTASGTRLEAEAAALGGNSRVFTNMVGASGNKLVGNINTAGSYVQFNNLPTTQSVDICYSSINTGTISIYINGTHVKDAVFTSTGGWYGVGSFSILRLSLPLNKGDSLKIQFDTGDAVLNVDYIECLPPTYTKFEAESGVVSGSASAQDGQTGASGLAVVGMMNTAGASVTFEDLPETTFVNIGYSSRYSGKISLYVNGAHIRDVTFATTGTWVGAGVFKNIWLELPLSKGDSLKIQYDTGDTALNIDYIECFNSSYPKFEAENAVTNGSATVFTGQEGASGSTVVGNLNTKNASVTFANLPNASSVNIRYSSKYTGKISIYVNDTSMRDLNFTSTGYWTGAAAFQFLSLNIKISGGDSLKIQFDEGDAALNIDYIECVYTKPSRLEAEDAQMFIANAYPGIAGASGNKVAGNLNQVGSSVSFNSLTKVYAVTVRYASMNSGSISVYLNGTHTQDLAFTATGGWFGEDCFQTLSFYIAINNGDSLKFQYDAGDAPLFLDYIEPDKTKFRFEAEDGECDWGAEVLSNQEGASGNKVVGNLTDNAHSLVIRDVPPTSRIGVRYASPNTGTISLSINGKYEFIQVPFTSTGGWSGEGKYNTVYFDVDITSVSYIRFSYWLGYGNASLNIDYIELITNLPEEPTTEPGKFEAENATMLGDASAFLWQAGASGNGLAGNLNSAGSAALFTGLPEASAIDIRYASPNAGTISVYLNDVHAKDVTFTSTGGWNGEGKFNTIRVPLAIGEGDSLKIQYDTGDAVLNLDYIQCFNAFGAVGAPIRLEAENAAMSGSATVFSGQAGASGNSLVGNLHAAGSAARFTGLPAANAVDICYASPNSGTVSVYLNDVHAKDVTFASTGGWSGEGKFNIIRITLEISAGDSLKIQYDAGDAVMNLDYIECLTVTESTPEADAGYKYTLGTLRLEAEDAVLGGQVYVYNDAAASGNKIVGDINDDGDFVQFNDVPAATSVTVRYASAEVYGYISVYVNGVDVSEIGFPGTGGWSGEGHYRTVTLAINLKQGDDFKILCEFYDQAISLDYIELNDASIWIPGSSDSMKKNLAAGANHTLMLDTDNTIWAWGGNEDGQLGNNGTASSSSPVQISSLSQMTGIAAGGDLSSSAYHSAGLKADGTVFAWGDNTYGQLGNDTNVNSSVPVRVNGITDVIGIACGGRHTVALKWDGTVYTWGDNQYGQLGNGTTVNSSVPVKVSGIKDIVAIAAAGNHTVALKSDGTVYAWGSNQSGQLGNGTFTDSTIPVQVTGLNHVASVAAGYKHTAALKDDGTVYAWGYNYFGQLGNDTNTNSASPVEVKNLAKVTAIACGYYHTLALKTDRTVRAWGGNINGQLGNGTQTDAYTPVQVSGLDNVNTIAGGAIHSAARKINGSVITWGGNTSGQLGNGGTVNSPAPVQAIPIQRTFTLEIPQSAQMPLMGVKSIAAGAYHVLALNTDGTVWTWGRNQFGELGDGTTVNSTTPVQVIGLKDIVAIEGGGSLQEIVNPCAHSVALRSDGTVFTWGSNEKGQLGNGTLTNSSVPVKVNGLTGVVAVAAGLSHTAALKSDGTVWTWGNNDCMQLGSVGEEYSQSTIPVQVPNMTDVVAIACGEDHTLALKSDGTVWAWGSDFAGQIGDGKYADPCSPPKFWRPPTKVNTVRNAVAITAGYQLSAALTEDGSVWVWGRHNGTQGRDPSVDPWSVGPVKVDGVSDITNISLGNGHILALYNNGTVWAWGSNSRFQLGHGNRTDMLYWAYPTRVESLNNIVDIVGSCFFSVALKDDGTVYCWGNNAFGVFGNGTGGNWSTVSITPVQANSLPEFQLPLPVTPDAGSSGIAAGTTFTAAIRSDGTVWTWGNNTYGELGIGTTAESLVPKKTNTLTNISAVSANSSGNHAVALESDGTVWTWGRNSYGQLGTGNQNNSPNPVKVIALTNVAAVSAGAQHTAAVKTDGTVWTWGYNNQGQLGNGTTTNSSLPVKVNSLSNVVAVACGESHTAALKSDGTVWIFGNGASTPVQVSEIDHVSSIAAGKSLTAALKPDGNVWIWGDNANGQFGNGTTTGSSTPLRINELTNVVSLSFGKNHTAALRLDGTVWSWGQNAAGQLGNNGKVNSYLPVRTSILTDVAVIGCGSAHAAAAKHDGTVWWWGESLNNGSLTLSSLLPVQSSNVVYLPNGGTGAAPTETSKSAGVIFTAAENSLTAPAGKRFKQWNTAANGSGTAYGEGAAITMPGASLILYAVWETCVAPTVTTSVLSDGAIGIFYSVTLNAGGTAPIAWSIASGDLPDGLNLSGGTITGTPTAVGTFDFTVMAENSVGYDTQDLCITIGLGLPENILTFYTDNITVSAAAASLEDGTYRFYRGGTLLGDTALVGTGCVVRKMDGETVLSETTIIVKGDINGDGVVDALDVFLTDSVMNNHKTLSGIYFWAANCEETDNKITISDLSVIMNLAVDKAV